MGALFHLYELVGKMAQTTADSAVWLIVFALLSRVLLFYCLLVHCTSALLSWDSLLSTENPIQDSYCFGLPSSTVVRVAT